MFPEWSADLANTEASNKAALKAVGIDTMTAAAAAIRIRRKRSSAVVAGAVFV